MSGEQMVQKINFLLLWGGVDISHVIYRHEKHPRTQAPNLRRDKEEMDAFNEYVDAGLPIIGVCRGAQMVCALNGGSLYQHSNDHACSHDLITNDGGVLSRVPAGHHQVMNPQGNYEVFARDSRSSVVEDVDGNKITLEQTPEIIWWPETKSLAIQPHPEWCQKGDPFIPWINSLVYQLTNVKDLF